MAHGTIEPDMRKCIDDCLTCYAACEETTAHCLSMGGKHADAHHITTLADCAKLCETAANFMLRMTHQHGAVCVVCADACDHCAESCEAIDDADATMKRCIDACRRCAASCRSMVGAHA